MPLKEKKAETATRHLHVLVADFGRPATVGRSEGNFFRSGKRGLSQFCVRLGNLRKKHAAKTAAAEISAAVYPRTT